MNNSHSTVPLNEFNSEVNVIDHSNTERSPEINIQSNDHREIPQVQTSTLPIIHSLTSEDDFESVSLISEVKRPKLLELTSKDESSQPEEDSVTCPICFENWTSNGEHRVVSLKCGHLFGKVCIERWLKNSVFAGNKGKCPQCNCEAKKSDIRLLFTKKIVTYSCEECDKLEQELLAERKLCSSYKEKEVKLDVDYKWMG